MDKLANTYGVSRARLMSAAVKAGLESLNKTADSPFTPMILKVAELVEMDKTVKSEIEKFRTAFNEQKEKQQGKLEFAS